MYVNDGFLYSKNVKSLSDLVNNDDLARQEAEAQKGKLKFHYDIYPLFNMCN